LLLTGDHTVFYFQERVGLKNSIFKIFKFTTMVSGAENMGTGDITVKNDPRVTAMGKFLRKTKINELPQILNILLGDMSLVGPRPLMPKGFQRYSKHYQERIYDVKPGLTGIGSIVFRDEESLLNSSSEDPQYIYEHIIMPHKGALEMWYQENRGFITDLKILINTAWVVLFPSSTLHRTFFSGLPSPPDRMRNFQAAENA